MLNSGIAHKILKEIYMKFEPQIQSISNMSSMLPGLIESYLKIIGNTYQSNLIDKKLMGEMINRYISLIDRHCELGLAGSDQRERSEA